MSKPLLEKLIQEIAKIDMDAAFALHCRKDNEDYNDKYNLGDVMAWRKTPEGYYYWSDVNDKLEARRKNYHPHRDLMIEYANDKTIEIEFLGTDGEWVRSDYPTFNQKYEYRKKPKVTKKVLEYRMFLDPENKINMIERRYIVNPSPAYFKQWLGDWQKVEIEVEQND